MGDDDSTTVGGEGEGDDDDSTTVRGKGEVMMTIVEWEMMIVLL